MLGVWTDTFVIAGFIVTWLAGWTAVVYSRGKSDRTNAEVNERLTKLEAQRVKDLEKHASDLKQFRDELSSQIADLKAAFSSDIAKLFNSFKDSEGDVKYLTFRRHSEICSAYQRSMATDNEHIKGDLQDLKRSVQSVQDTLLALATSPQKKE